MNSGTPKIAIACGGTGGHLFPGLAVAEQLARRGGNVTLLVSPKKVDQQAVQAVSGMEIVTLPAIGLTRGRMIAFARGFWQSYRAAKKYFQNHPPHAALAMGGFTSAPPILAARKLGARTFLHESNTIPGRANRWLSRVVNEAFVGFPQAAERMHCRTTTVTGTPVRDQFKSMDAEKCRQKLFGVPPSGASGKPPEGGTPNQAPVLLVMGGSQGAAGINELVLKALPLLARRAPGLRLIHIAGLDDAERIRQTAAALGITAVVHSFFAEMDVALGAATLAISRAGASSLAELAAVRVPAILIPYPAATDDHQFHNARAFEQTGAARLLEQRTATPERLADLTLQLLSDCAAGEAMRVALGRWHAPRAAEQIAEAILTSLTQTADASVAAHETAPAPPDADQNRLSTYECHP